MVSTALNALARHFHFCDFLVGQPSRWSVVQNEQEGLIHGPAVDVQEKRLFAHYAVG